MEVFLSDLPKALHIMEVGPRDGLQIEPRSLSADEKLRLIKAITAAGVNEVEAGSFVNPKAVPNMANSTEVFERLERVPGVKYRALWLNGRGLESAIQSGKVDIDGRLRLTASEIFVKRNTNKTIEETFPELDQWIDQYRSAGVEPDQVGMMAAFGCNFEGEIPRSRVISLIERAEKLMNDKGAKMRHLTLADTMGWGNPAQVHAMVSEIRSKWPDLKIKLHLHDTRGAAMANAYAAIKLGVTDFDGSVGGLGGCPFAGKAAAGNICTEDLVFMAHEMGIETGIDLDALVEAAKLAEDLLGHTIPGAVMKGGTRTTIGTTTH